MKFKYFPSSGKYIYFTGTKTKYYVRYNSEGDVHLPNNRRIDWRLPKFIWDRL